MKTENAVTDDDQCPGMPDEALLLALTELVRRAHAEPDRYLVGDVWHMIPAVYDETWPADLCRLIDAAVKMIAQLIDATTDVDEYLSLFTTRIRFAGVTAPLVEGDDHV